MAKPTQPLLPSCYTLQTARAELAELLDVYADSDEQERSLFDQLIPELRDFIEAEEEKICHQANTQEEIEAEIVYASAHGQTMRVRGLEYELGARKAYDASPLSFGDSIAVGPPWRMGRVTGDRGSYGPDAISGHTGTVLGFTRGGEVLIADPLDRSYPWIPTQRVYDAASQLECSCGAWSDKHRAAEHAAGCPHH